MESRYGQTSFRDYSHIQLVAMLQAGQVPPVGAVGARWRDVANGLDGIALTLEQQHRAVADLWDGPAARAHEAMVGTLVDGLRQVAFTARRLGDQIVAAAEALRRAQERMASLPPPVEVRAPDDAVLIAASTRVRDERWAESAARQAQAMRAIQDFRRARAAAATVTAAAVQIMEELRDAYRNIDLPRPPAIEEPPTIGPDGAPVFSAAPTTGAGVGPSRLLADLWRNGLIATAGIPPVEVLPPATPGVGTSAPGPVVAAPPVATPQLPDRSAPDLSRYGGGGSWPGRAGPLPSFGGLDDGHLDGQDAVRAVGSASVTPGAAGGKAVPTGVPSTSGMPFFPPMMGGFAPPMGAGGELRRSDVPWLIRKVPGLDADDIEVVDGDIKS